MLSYVLTLQQQDACTQSDWETKRSVEEAENDVTVLLRPERKRYDFIDREVKIGFTCDLTKT